eukprot:TRINITY_DN35108_c0_g1_i1.p1 TRINITY_DN35108_c0_g1~~TRINITY_DN35108_c0_g1_i1.p1  ORF type:complete len:280 (+),score=35.12 TRINITY_DN35108_c0_g1_i1:166-1005(+)
MGEWIGIFQFGTLASTCIHNAQLLYQKLRYKKEDPIWFLPEIINDWEQFMEIVFEILNERIEPLIVWFEVAKSVFKLYDYLGLLSLGVDVHINKTSFEKLRFRELEEMQKLRLGDRVLPRLSKFLMHAGLVRQFSTLQEKLATTKLAASSGIFGKLKLLGRNIFRNPWVLAELLRIFRPLLLILAIRHSAPSSPRPLFAGLAIDLLSILGLHFHPLSKDSPGFQVDYNEEKKSRLFDLVRYLMFSPVHNVILKKITSWFSPQSIVVALFTYFKFYSFIL